jgi:predicted lipid carrier protein YhbT
MMNISFTPTATNPVQKFPVFPPLLARPIALLPEKLHTTAIVKILNTLLKESLQDGDLNFLQGQHVSVEITDLKLRFALSLKSLGQETLIGCRWQENDDLNLRGNFYDFLLLASREEDSDTLFFQRRLKMTGSTNLGLEVKNLLDGLDTESVQFHRQIDFALQHVIRFYRCGKIFRSVKNT